MYFKLIFVILAAGIAMYLFYNGTQVGFQPRSYWTIILFSTGFLSGLALCWLLLPKTSGAIVLIASAVAGVLWGYTMPERWKFIKAKMKKDN